MSSMETIDRKLARIEQQQEELDRRKAELREQRRIETRRARAKERKQREQVLIALGSVLEEHVLGGDWTKADMDAVEELARAAGEDAAGLRTGPSRSPQEALAAVREWEKARR